MNFSSCLRFCCWTGLTNLSHQPDPCHLGFQYSSSSPELSSSLPLLKLFLLPLHEYRRQLGSKGELVSRNEREREKYVCKLVLSSSISVKSRKSRIRRKKRKNTESHSRQKRLFQSRNTHETSDRQTLHSSKSMCTLSFNTQYFTLTLSLSHTHILVA